MKIYDYVLIYGIFGAFSGIRELFLLFDINKQIKQKKFGIKLVTDKTISISAIGVAIFWPIYWIYSFIQAYNYTKKVRKMFPDMSVSMWDFL